MPKSSSWGLAGRVAGFLTGRGITLLLFLVVVVLFVVAELIAPGFLAPSHVGAILRTASFLGIVAVGQTLVVLTGGIDLSVGALVTMGNVFICMFMGGQNANNLWSLALILTLGAGFGTVSGIGVAYLKISPLVMTLAAGSLVTGVTLIFSQGAPKGLASPFLREVGVGTLFNALPNIVLVWVVLSAVVIAVLARSLYGRRLYYSGANPRAAALSGVPVRPVKVVAYAASGACAVLSGALMAGYTRTAFLGIGNEYIMWSIAAVVIGGTSLTGGRGGYAGTIAGAIILVLLESILTVVKMPEAGRRVASGVIILVMITIYFRRRPRG
jgi:ribose transport system permease protein